MKAVRRMGEGVSGRRRRQSKERPEKGESRSRRGLRVVKRKALADTLPLTSELRMPVCPCAPHKRLPSSPVSSRVRKGEQQPT